MTQIIAIANQKGGVGKTTTAVNVGDYLADAGKRVLIIDMDPQANATSGLGVNPRAVPYSTYTVLHNPKRGVGYALTDTTTPGLILLPATLDLAAAEFELMSAPARESILKRALLASRLHFDYILIDTPPSFTLLTQNAMVAADSVLVPVAAEVYPLQGLEQLERTMGVMQDVLNPGLQIGGVVVTMADTRNNLARDVIEELRRIYAERVYQTAIPRNVKLAEAPAAGQPIRLYAPESTGARAYQALTQEMLNVQA